ncbi:hypothetical protein M501DRAFT_1034190 [Patellaria atrata CBS 101060]|uniref:Uncharacterized protein n=1 Tax=Patellaria atrata CBS 101060 TaxID=1346257 RepID=A0A9P4S446_9PEZI|nr:hypothetical protein M501DRAFT_1034190 [Patellaria atrata CBS 101060]
MAAVANGALTPPVISESSVSSTLATKRKRSPSSAQALPNGDHVEEETQILPDPKLPSRLLEDIGTVLRNIDTSPSILERPLRTSRGRSPSREPSSKKTKLSETDPRSIISKLLTGAYFSLEDLTKDVEEASSAVLASVQEKENMPNGIAHKSVEYTTDKSLLAKVLAFKKVTAEIVAREEQRKRFKTQNNPETKAGMDGVAKVEINGIVNGLSKISVLDGSGNGRAVLTLYANAQGPKQLFSSLQRPQSVRKRTSSSSESTLDSSIKVVLPLDDSTFPNMICSSTILPFQDSAQTKDQKKIPTLGELFPPPPGLAPLHPPRPAKQSSTRGSTIIWGATESNPKSNRKSVSTYSTQKLTVGQSLGYSGVDIPQEPTSPAAKRKQRDRALSTGEVHPPPSEAAIASLQQAKTDALFRSVYSSFAPCRDNSVAVVPEETKNRMWWHKIGHKKFQEPWTVDPALLEPEEANNGMPNADPVDEVEAFEEAVNNFVPEDDIAAQEYERFTREKEVHEILQEISEMLETLSSFQRIRNASLASNIRNQTTQSSSTSLMGSPTTPSSAELDHYNLLKSQLSLMISMLPPYAVAKLNGDQLADLNISRNIVIETNNYEGMMEEDQASRNAKTVALNAPVSGSSTARTVSGNPAPPAHYPNASPAFTRPIPTPLSRQGPQSYYPQQQPPSRSPAVNYSRPPTGASTYQSQPAFPPQRQGYGQPPYNQPAPRPQYNPPNPQQFYQRPPTQGYGVGQQYYQPSPHSQPPSRGYQQGPSPAYGQRPPSTPGVYGYGASPSPHPPAVSPVKQAAANYSAHQYNQSRPTYPTPNPGQPRPQYYPQPPSQSTPQSNTPVGIQPQPGPAIPTAPINHNGPTTPQPPNGQDFEGVLVTYLFDDGKYDWDSSSVPELGMHFVWRLQNFCGRVGWASVEGDQKYYNAVKP